MLAPPSVVGYVWYTFFFLRILKLFNLYFDLLDLSSLVKYVNISILKFEDQKNLTFLGTKQLVTTFFSCVEFKFMNHLIVVVLFPVLLHVT